MGFSWREGDPVGSPSAIDTFMQSELAQFASVYTDEGDIPSTVESRGDRGTFYNNDDLEKYLNLGHLLTRDSNGNPIINPLVHILITYNDFLDQYELEVWIGYDE